MGWTPGQYNASLAAETPWEDVPDHLYVQLRQWVLNFIRDCNCADNLAVSLRLDLTTADLTWITIEDLLCEIMERDRERILDSIEWLLKKQKAHPVVHGRAVNNLEQLLSDGNSIYTINDRRNGLELRVDLQVKEVTNTTIAAAGGSSAGEHLQKAWESAYARIPDPVKAYSEAIKAVEAAAAPVISANNERATLGTIIRDLKASPTKWNHPLPHGISISTTMMETLWTGQTSRHGGITPTRHETETEAQAAIHIAACLVAWFLGGTVHS